MLRSKALEIFQDAVRMLDVVKGEYPQVARTYLVPILPQWMESMMIQFKMASPTECPIVQRRIIKVIFRFQLLNLVFSTPNPRSIRSIIFNLGRQHSL